VAIPIAIINPVASATDEQTTEELAERLSLLRGRLLTATAATTTARLTTTQPWPVDKL
jgi:hypothetical protein